LIQSNQKSSRQKGFFAHQAFALQTMQNHGLESFAPLAFAHSPRFSKISYAPAAHKATIVLPAFARSCFADTGEEKKILSVYPSLLFNLSS
jgi:hypothetical protein